MRSREHDALRERDAADEYEVIAIEESPTCTKITRRLKPKPPREELLAEAAPAGDPAALAPTDTK